MTFVCPQLRYTDSWTKSWLFMKSNFNYWMYFTTVFWLIQKSRNSVDKNIILSYYLKNYNMNLWHALITAILHANKASTNWAFEKLWLLCFSNKLRNEKLALHQFVQINLLIHSHPWVYLFTELLTLNTKTIIYSTYK